MHAKGGYIYLQLVAFGRMAMPAVLGSHPYVGASSIPQPGRPEDEQRPRPLTVDEIKEYAQLYAQAANNAVEGAGFDGPWLLASLLAISSDVGVLRCRC